MVIPWKRWCACWLSRMGVIEAVKLDCGPNEQCITFDLHHEYEGRTTRLTEPANSYREAGSSSLSIVGAAHIECVHLVSSTTHHCRPSHACSAVACALAALTPVPNRSLFLARAARQIRL